MQTMLTPTHEASEPAAPEAAGSPARRHSRRVRAFVLAAVLLVALAVTVLMSTTIGQFDTSPRQVLTSIGRVLFGGADPTDHQVDAVLWTIRFPRAVLAVLVGASLAVSGAVMQGVFANPLAEPSIIGVSSGASVGAALVIVLGIATVMPWTLPIAAFVTALVVTAVVWGLAHIGGRAGVLTLILTGIAVNAICVAATSFLIFIGNTASRETIIFWQMGTLSDASWSGVGTTALVCAAGTAGCMLIRRKLDVLALGDASAATTGVHVETLRVTAIVLACLLTGVAVAFGGIIAFVGLIVPHAIRLVVGPSHRYLVPLSVLGGAVLLSLADIAARTVIDFADLPIGIFTAVAGGPIFLLLLRRTLRGQGMGAT